MITPSAQRSPKVSIVVLNYRNYTDTISCLQSLARITYPNREIIVVDNCSENDSLRYIREDLAARAVSHKLIDEETISESPQIVENTILVQSRKNGGYAAGNNLGIRVALERGADYVLILNNDTSVEREFLEPLVEHADSNKNIGAVGPKVIDHDGSILRACARRRRTALSFFFGLGVGRKLCPNNRWVRAHTYDGEYSFDKPKEVDVLSGCCLMLKQSALRTIGLFDENTFLYLEEFILHEQLRQIGLVSVIVPASTITHKGGQSTSMRPSEFVRKAERDSLYYYLVQYRCWPKFIAALVLLNVSGIAGTVRTISQTVSRPPKHAHKIVIA